jgi:catechol 2,3-dioxygenase-like lactoylglutathione lyase family enzyme
MAKTNKPKSRKGTGTVGGLSTGDVVAFAGTTDPERAMSFYRDTLGLELEYSDDFAVVFKSNGTTIRVAVVPKVVPAGYTILGWMVADLEATVAQLKKAGVKFERYPGMEQDPRGIWSAPSGARIAWFKDPDGNTLSVGQ